MSLDLSFLNDLKAGIHLSAALSDYTTFRLGGVCPCVVTCQTPHQLSETVKRFNEKKIDFILIGGGSNLVISDAGLSCVVIRYAAAYPIIRQEDEDIIVTGSSSLDALALFAAQCGLEGLNYTTGIPGTVGGAVVGNAGAFGKQVGDVLKSVVLLSPQGARKEVGPQDLGFRYRHSRLKETKDIVLEVRFHLQAGDSKALLQEREEILALRREKHPDLKVYPCAGSFFRNIEPTSRAGKRQASGWFLEQAGGKELRVGGAAIFAKHANIIVKSAGCTSQNIYELSLLMQKLVKEKFGLTLEREVRFVGNFTGMPKEVKEIIW